ncbi:hypothetical protein [Streptomyces sp. NPDC046727]|uniref:hypothetical protein n=1 Tax=Streptomyces sp. NPDC046727 TaxID=3155373 RepID=UPI0033F12D25
METAKIVLAYVEALTWPVMIVMLVYLLRTHLAGLIGRLSVISTPAGDLEFAADVNQVHNAVVEAVGGSDSASRTPGILRSQVRHGAQDLGAFDALRDVAASAPDAAIMAAWRRVELRLSEAHCLVRGTSWENERTHRVFPITPRRWAEDLVATGLDADVAEIIAELVSLRNRAAHSPDVSGISALEYVESCAVVWALLGRFMAAHDPSGESMITQPPTPLN